MACSAQACLGSNMCRPRHIFGSIMFRLKLAHSCRTVSFSGIGGCCVVGCGDASVRASPWPSLGNRFEVQIGLRTLTHIIDPNLKDWICHCTDLFLRCGTSLVLTSSVLHVLRRDATLVGDNCKHIHLTIHRWANHFPLAHCIRLTI